MEQAEKPLEQRPECAAFWDKRFGEGVTPWDAGRAPGDFVRFFSEQRPLPVLIPGCGSAWEAAWLDERQWPVTALDFSPAAVAAARKVLGEWSGRLICGDFFDHTPEPAPRIVYERAFLCALPRKLWADWGRRVAELLPTGGLLVGYFFVCDQLKGPPFGIEQSQLEGLLLPHFQCEEDRPVADSIPVFAGRERWQVWRRY